MRVFGLTRNGYTEESQAFVNKTYEQIAKTTDLQKLKIKLKKLHNTFGQVEESSPATRKNSIF